MNPGQSQPGSEAEGYPQSFVTHQPFTNTRYISAFSAGADLSTPLTIQGKEWFPLGPPIPTSEIQIFPAALAATQSTLTGGIPGQMFSGDVFSETQTGPVDCRGNPVFQNPIFTDPLSLDEGVEGEVVDHNASDLEPMSTEQQWAVGAPIYFSADTGPQSLLTPNPLTFDQSTYPLRSTQTWPEGDKTNVTASGTMNRIMGPPEIPVRSETYPGSLANPSSHKVERSNRRPNRRASTLISPRRPKVTPSHLQSLASNTGTAEAELARVLGSTRRRGITPQLLESLVDGTAEAEIARVRGYRRTNR
jgi:hypothetical protein